MARNRKSQEDLMLEDIINQVMGVEAQEGELRPEQFTELTNLEGQPDVDPMEMKKMAQPGGLFEALEQMTGAPKEDQQAMDDRDFYMNIVDEIDPIVQRKIAADLTQRGSTACRWDSRARPSRWIIAPPRRRPPAI